MMMYHRHKMSRKGRTELIIGVSEAKYRKEPDFDVQKCPAPQKLLKNIEKPNFRVGTNPTTFFFRRKMKCWESSETRFVKF